MERIMSKLNLQAADNKCRPRAANLLGLPTEILTEICQKLCIHCRCPRIGELTKDDANEAIKTQRALANLSQCSKRLRDISQPVLFHFFHCLEGEIGTRRRLASLVRALFRRRDLASSVRSLVLWTPDDDELVRLAYSERLACAIKDDDHTIERAAESLGLWWVGRQYGFMMELQELVMALASRASYILLQRTYLGRSPAKVWTTWPQPMGSLKHLVLVGFRQGYPRECSYCLTEAKALLSHAAPNLESLVAIDCGGDGTNSPEWVNDMPWSFQLPSIRKLSINGRYIGPLEVGEIIRHSAVFEDLEFFQSPADVWRVVLDPDVHLGTARSTLKRLCYSVFPTLASLRRSDVRHFEEYELSDDDDDDDYNDGYFDATSPDLGGFDHGLSLRGFSVLERLEMEQLLFYGTVFAGPDEVQSDRSRELVSTGEFLSKLPSSLQFLRMGCIFYWPIVYRDMMALAGEKRSSGLFPNLRSAALEVLKTPPRDEHDRLVEVYRRAGITLSISYVVRDPWSRGLLPQRPGYTPRSAQPVAYW